MLLKCCTQYVSILENSAMAIGLEKVSFHSNPKERQCQKCSNYCSIGLISDASKVILKIPQARLQQYVNWELPDVQPWFRKSWETRDQIVDICWIIEKAREFQKKKSTSASLTMLKPLTILITTDWKILKEMRIPGPLTWLLRNLYVGQEATVRTRHGTMDWFQIGKRLCKAIYCLPAYLTYM